jgi:hypothetical protein
LDICIRWIVFFKKKSKLNYWSPPNSTIKNSWCFCVAERYTLIYTIRSGDNWKLFSPNSGPPYPSRRHPSHVLEVDRVEGLWSTKKCNLESVSAKNKLFLSPNLFLPTHLYSRPAHYTYCQKSREGHKNHHEYESHPACNASREKRLNWPRTPLQVPLFFFSIYFLFPNYYFNTICTN